MRTSSTLLALAASLAGCRSSAPAGDPPVSDAAAATPSATSTTSTTTATGSSPSGKNVPASGPFKPGNNRATVSGKPFPAIDGPRDPESAVRKAIPVTLTTPNADVALGRGFLLRETKSNDRARWFVMRIENKTSKTEWAVRVVYTKFLDPAGKRLGGGHNVEVRGSACDTEKNLASGQHLGLPGVGAFMGGSCLGAGEAGWAVVDLQSEDECAATHPCATGAAEIGSVELQVWTSSTDPGAVKGGPLAVAGPASQVVPTGYDVSGDRVSLTLTNRGPSPAMPFLVKGVGLDASGDPLLVMTFAADRKTRIAPGGTQQVEATSRYRGPAAVRLDGWMTFIETTPP